jgi:lipoprotein-releasing system permease protein
MATIRGVWEIFAADQLGWNRTYIKYTDIITSKEKQSQYVAELLKQMGILLLIFAVVSFGVVVLVFCIFYMIVRLKLKDIAIIKSCGATSTSVAQLFLGFGGCIGIIGAAAGTILGYVIIKNINTIENWIRIIFGLKLWKASVYMFDRIPNDISWNWALIIAILAIVSVMIGALIPAIMAAWTKPVNILRYE